MKLPVVVLPNSMSLRRMPLSLFLLAVVCLLLPTPVRAQVQLVPVITTVAGNGISGYSGDNAAATGAELNNPHSLAMDLSGNLYIADQSNHRVRKIDTNGTITTVAGTGTAGFSGDNGTAVNAELNHPGSVTVDAFGNLYISDTFNNRVREVTASTGYITTVVGNGTAGFSGDGGPAISAELLNPYGLAVDGSGNLYIADLENNRVREVNPEGVITTVAGNGIAGYMGDNGPATSAALNAPVNVCLDAFGNLFIADSGNNRIREVNVSGNITTVAGNGNAGFSGDNGLATSAEFNEPYAVVVDRYGDLIIADAGNHRIREVNSSGIVTTVAGNGGEGYSGDNGSATSAALYAPVSEVLDATGNLYVADFWDFAIRKVSELSPGINETINTFPTTAIGSSAVVRNVLIETTATETISSISVPVPQGGFQEFSVGAITGCTIGASNASGTICTIPITFTPAYPGLRQISLRVVTSAGNVNFGLQGTGMGPQVALTPGIITTVAGEGTGGFSGDNGPATSAELWGSTGVALDGSGNLYIADYGNNRIREVSSSGIIATVAGNGTQGFSGDNGPATSAELNYPRGVALDASGNLYIVDEGNQRIRKVGPSGVITTVAGNGAFGFSGDNGPATSAELLGPIGVALDASGNLYIADDGNNRIRKVSPSGIITTVAGNGTQGFSGDNGPATSAELNQPIGVALDASGNLYIGDYGNNRIRKVSPSGIITTVAGNGTQGFSGDNGTATSAELNWPYGVALDASGNLYIADAQNSRIRKVSPSGIITTVAGNGGYSYSGDNGPATSAGLNFLQNVAVDASGNLYIADTDNERIRKVNVGSTSSLNFASTVVGSQSADSPQSFEISNIGNSALTLSIPSAGNNPSIATGFSYDGSSTCPQLSVSSNPYSLAPGAGCTLAVDFIPFESGLDNGNLVLSDNSLNNSGSAQTVSLNGTEAAPLVDATSTIVNISLASLMAGQSATVTATVTDTTNSGSTPTGTVTFTDSLNGGTPAALNGGNPVALISSVATLPGVMLSQGSHAISATYAGMTGMFLASNGSTSTVTVSADLPATASGSAATNFGTKPVASSSNQTVTFTFSSAGTIGTVTVVTQGATDVDFTDVGDGTCNADAGSHVFNVNDTCTVDVKFAPKTSGVRLGAVLLKDSSGNVLAMANVYGVGSGPQIAYGPGSPTATYPTANGIGLAFPSYAAIDAAGNLFISDEENARVLKIPAGGGAATAIAAVANGEGLSAPAGLAVDGAGNLFIADFQHNRVVEVPMDGGAAIAIAPSVNGIPLGQVSGVAIDGAGDLFLTDTENARAIEIPAGGGTAIAVNTSVGLSAPRGIVVDGIGDLFISDQDLNRIVEVPAGGGTPIVIDPTVNGESLKNPLGIALDSAGDLFVADLANNRVVEAPAGGGTPLAIDPSANGSGLTTPVGVGLDSAGDLFIIDSGNNRVVELQRSQAPTLSFAQTFVGYTSSDSPQTIAVQNIGNAPLAFSAVTYPGDFPESSAGDATDCTLSTNLVPAATCTLTIDFTPQSGASLSESVIMIDNALNVTGATQSISVSGTGETDATTTSLTSSPNPSIFGQPVTVTAAVLQNTSPIVPTGAAPAGTVQFFVDGTPALSPANLSSGTATYMSSALAVGTHSITATFTPAAGNGFLASSSAGWRQVVTIAGPLVAPVISPTGGTYSSAQMVTLTDAMFGAVLYYTTDGSIPTTNSTLYTGPITVSSSETITAIATASGYSPSPSTTAPYLITPLAVGGTLQWTWMGGASNGGQHGVYGSLRAPAAGNIPGSRLSATMWTDGQGNLWLFGGAGTAGLLNDLWELNPSTNQWTWVGGSSTADQAGVYGTLGSPAAGNIPGGRSRGASWTDINGNLWLFGGQGYDGVGRVGQLNDLWEFSPSTNEWTWISGSSTLPTPVSGQSGEPGVYGVLGTYSAASVPGGRGYASSWTDSSGHLWLLGGDGFDANGNEGFLNDLWEFNPSTNQWAWMGGGSTIPASGSGEGGLPGLYGTLGTPASANSPGSRYLALSWTDNADNLWLFGGWGCDANGNSGYLNDLWKFNPSTNQWAWVSGGSSVPAANSGQPGVYGTLGTAATGNIPGGHFGGASWNDSKGDLWLFGGLGIDASGSAGYLNDLWEFSPSTNQWTWMAGSSTVGANGGEPGVYGTLGTPAGGNIPGGRFGAASWNDSTGNLWLFGGFGFDANGAEGDLNDLWEYQPPAASLPAAASPTFSVAAGTYNAPQTVTISDATNGATIYYTTNGTTPNEASSVYSSSIEVSATETLKAIAVGTNYKQSAIATAGYTINIPVTPSITWAAPGPISYGTPLSAAQLNASSTVAGTFTYSPASGAVLAAGTQTLTVTFTPTDTTDFTTATATVQVLVTKAMPAITWAAPSAIIYGTAIGATQLNATSTVPGTFAYSPAAGVVLAAGSQTLSVTFTPTDTTDYVASTATVTLLVNQAKPAITWAAPAAITYGTALTAAQLNASSTLSGNLNYAPALGTVLGAGPQTLSVTFTPADTTDYATSTQTVQLTVNKAALTVAATNSSVMYNQPIPKLTYSVRGYVNGDPPTVVSGIPAETTTGTQGSPLGDYPITIGPGSLAATNYNFQFQNGTLTITPLGTTATPTFSPAAGSYTSAQTVTISDATPGAIVYYTTNNATPTTSSAQYTGPITVSTSETIKAIAVASGYTQSLVATGIYTLPAATPTFSLSSGTYISPQSLTISDSTTGASIYFTVNGTTPSTSSSLYSGPIALSGTENVKAIAVAAGYLQSGIASASYTIARVPSVTTSAATNVGPSAATLNGTVTANNATTKYWFAFGTSPAALTNLTAKTGALTGTAASPVSANLTGLVKKTTYYFQLVATNAAGTTSGAVLSFVTK